MAYDRVEYSKVGISNRDKGGKKAESGITSIPLTFFLQVHIFISGAFVTVGIDAYTRQILYTPCPELLLLPSFLCRTMHSDPKA